jgi:hypothetical protein
MKVTVNGRLVAEGTHEECSPTLFRYLGMLSVECVAMGPWGWDLEQHDLTLGDTPDADVAYFAGIPVEE